MVLNVPSGHIQNLIKPVKNEENDAKMCRRNVPKLFRLQAFFALALAPLCKDTKKSLQVTKRIQIKHIGECVESLCHHRNRGQTGHTGTT